MQTPNFYCIILDSRSVKSSAIERALMDNSTVILVIAAFGFVCLILSVWLSVITLKMRRIFNREKTVEMAGSKKDFVLAIEESLNKLDEMRSQVDTLGVRHDELSGKLQNAVQKVGIVRFDAFEDIGGMLSYAVALLDNNGDGVLVCTINGRQESRSYAKPITKGESTFNLSMEERQAIEEALVMPSMHKSVYSRVRSKA
jgi:hypothetical protein